MKWLFDAGALLSLLVEPVYWSSIVVGSLYHRAHMTRAVFGRIKLDCTALPTGYRLTQPRLSPVSQPETRLPHKAPSLAINWLLEDPDSDQVELINTSTGKLCSGEASRLCKAAMFRLFSDTWHQLNTGQQFSPVYMDVKRMADDYQAAKITLYTAFREAGLGCWMERPMEQDNFQLSKLPPTIDHSDASVAMQ